MNDLNTILNDKIKQLKHMRDFLFMHFCVDSKWENQDVCSLYVEIIKEITACKKRLYEIILKG